MRQPYSNPFFTNPNVGCNKDCQFMEIGPTSSTLAYYTPVYDKNGRNISPPSGNIVRGKTKCLTCQKTWEHETASGVTKSTEVK
jgi:hypothetical protein